MSKNGNIYPHLPLVIQQIDDIPPWKAPPGLIAEFVTEGGKSFLNGSLDDLAAFDIDETIVTPTGVTDDDEYPGCVDKFVILFFLPSATPLLLLRH